MKTFITVISILIITSGLNIAQEKNKDTLVFSIPTEIVVTAPRLLMPLKDIPFATSIVTSEAFENLPRSVAADEALKLVPGVKVDNQANGYRVHLSIRGQGILTERGIRGIKIIHDGIPLNDPTGFAPDFYDIDFANVERIEVLRGPAASLYGGSSSGGIINIMTSNPEKKITDIKFYGTYGSNNFWKGLGRAGGTYDKFNYSVNFSRNSGDGYRVHTKFMGDNVYAKANYTPNSSLRISPIVYYTYANHQNAEGINLEYYNRDPKLPNDDAEKYNEFLMTKRLSGGFTGRYTVNKNNLYDFNGYYKRTDFTEANNHTFNDRIIDTYGGTFQYTLHLGKKKSMPGNNLSIGADLQRQTINEKRVDNIYGVKGDTVRSNEDIIQGGIGAFALGNFQITDNFNAFLNVRYDNIHNEAKDLLNSPKNYSGTADFSNTTGRIGFTYTPKEELNFYVNWGMGFLPPATEELLQNPDQFGGFNTHLTYASSQGFDLGVRGSYMNKIYYEVGGFYLSTKNDFDRYRISDPLRNQETFYRNIGASNRIGAEIYTKYNPVKQLNLQFAYTYSNFKYNLDAPVQIMMDDTTIKKYTNDGNYLPNSPMHQFVFDLQYNIMPDLFIGFSTETYSKSYIDGANIDAEAVAGYTLLYARLGYIYRFKGMNAEFNLYGKNLADTKYVAFSEPDPGGNSYQPGSGIEFFGGIKLNF